VVALLTGSTRFLLRMLGIRENAEAGLSEEELHALVEQGAESGVVPEAEHSIVENVFRLGDRQVASIMTARPDIEWIEIETPEPELHALLAEQRRPWFLVCRGHVERIEGVVHSSDLLAMSLRGQPLDLASVVGKPLFVPELAPVLQLLAMFRATRQHVAIALDEFGGVSGLVTLDHIVAELVGDQPSGSTRSALISRAADGWVAHGAVPIEDVAEALDLEGVEVDDPRSYRTLAGFVLARLGRVPVVGDVVTWNGWRFEVVGVDGRRIERVMMRPVDGA
jgi:putative hemolysin